MSHQSTLRRRIMIIVGAICGLLLILSLLTTSATVQALPPRPTPVLTPTPTAVPLHDARQGGVLELHVQPAQANVWTIIQWQAANGQWYDVNGWQGTLNDTTQSWWVAPADLGKGPFRWLVYQSRGGKLLGESKSFSLPGSNRETVHVEVSIKP